MRVKDLAEMLFGGVPYSRETAASQETIEASLKRELENAPGEPAQAMGSVMTRWAALRACQTII